MSFEPNWFSVIFGSILGYFIQRRFRALSTRIDEVEKEHLDEIEEMLDIILDLQKQVNKKEDKE